MKKIIYSELAPAPIGPYSQAVLVAEHTLYVSGQIPVNALTGEIPTSVEEQIDQVMRNIAHILTAADMDFSNIVKCSIFIKDMNDFARINAVYGGYFTQDPPARETVEVARLPKDVLVEISCIAVR